jgi:hypothetical protein
MWNRAFATLLLLATASACTKKADEAGRPSSVPPLDPAAAAPALPMPAMAPAAPPAAAPVAAPADPNASITGELVLPAAIAKTKPTGTLYLVARRISDNPTARGTLIAVKKLPATSFPLPFSLSAADMPFQTGAFDGDLTLTARIDQDGDPMTHQKGDVFGTLPKVHVGSRDVKLALDQVQKEAESLAGGGPMMGGGPGPGAGSMMGGGAQMPPGHP